MRVGTAHIELTPEIDVKGIQEAFHAFDEMRKPDFTRLNEALENFRAQALQRHQDYPEVHRIVVKHYPAKRVTIVIQDQRRANG